MGLIDKVFTLLFGNGTNVVRETAEVFRENTEAGAAREASMRSQALAQHQAEFLIPKKGLFDRFMDGVNRLPRPAMALGTLGLFVAAMVDPVWFAARMQGLSLVPEPLWWLLGAVVSFYFGARYQAKGQEFQRSIAQTMARTSMVMRGLDELRQAEKTPARRIRPETMARTATRESNAALDEWKRIEARKQDN